LTVGSTGVGTTAHLAMEELMALEGLTYIHVPYKGTADQMLAVAGQTLMVGVNSTGFAPYVETGRLRLLAGVQCPAQRALAIGADLERTGLSRRRAQLALRHRRPAGVDSAILMKLHDAFKTAMFEPEHLREIAKYDQEPAYLGTADYARAVQEISRASGSCWRAWGWASAAAKTSSPGHDAGRRSCPGLP
jgi:tripartite-type tricarboxylate transporter receptor subunit TctC